MRFFKYLLFFLISFFSVSAYSAYKYRVSNMIATELYDSKEAACSNWKHSWFGSPDIVVKVDVNYCIASRKSDGGLMSTIQIIQVTVPDECFHPDYKIVSQPITSLKKVMCLPINGSICKYVGDPTGSPIINGSITTTFSSVSKTPDPTCKEQLLNPPCDPKDPYGGCFTPPDDGCTRQFNGSIECPADTQPPIDKGCNGATYCDRPPQGCGEGYVSGSYNGKQICIKTSPSTGTGDGSGTGGDGSGTGSDGSGTGGDGSGTGGDGSGTGSTTGTGTGTSTSTNTTTNSDGSTTTTTNTTVNNFSIDFSPVTNAIKKLSDQLTNFKNELLTSVTDLGKKIDSTNQKLDSTNTKLTEINDSALRQEELLKAIRDKESPTGGDGSPSDQPASGASTDLTETNGILNEIKDWLTEEVKDDGQSVETPFKNLEQKDINSSLYKITGQCPAPKTFYVPLVGHTFQLDLTKFCNVLSIIGILVSIAACLHGVAILSENT